MPRGYMSVDWLWLRMQQQFNHAHKTNKNEHSQMCVHWWHFTIHVLQVSEEKHVHAWVCTLREVSASVQGQ